jgi:hypothetical protein
MGDSLKRQSSLSVDELSQGLVSAFRAERDHQDLQVLRAYVPILEQRLNDAVAKAKPQSRRGRRPKRDKVADEIGRIVMDNPELKSDYLGIINVLDRRAQRISGLNPGAHLLKIIDPSTGKRLCRWHDHSRRPHKSWKAAYRDPRCVRRLKSYIHWAISRHR